MRLSKPVGKDGTVRDLLVQNERIAGARDNRLDIRIPSCCAELWNAFVCLHRCRPPAMIGMQPLSLSEIAEYSRLYRVALSPWEVECIIAIDEKAREVLSEKKRAD